MGEVNGKTMKIDNNLGQWLLNAAFLCICKYGDFRGGDCEKEQVTCP